jgi:hypothetical protein
MIIWYLAADGVGVSWLSDGFPLGLKYSVDDGVPPLAPGVDVFANSPLLLESRSQERLLRRCVERRPCRPDAVLPEVLERQSQSQPQRLRAQAPAPRVGPQREPDCGGPLLVRVRGQAQHADQRSVVRLADAQGVFGSRVLAGRDRPTVHQGGDLLW